MFFTVSCTTVPHLNMGYILIKLLEEKILSLGKESKDDKGKGKKSDRRRDEPRKCFRCDRTNHIIKDCRASKKEDGTPLKKGDNNNGKKDDDTNEEEDVKKEKKREKSKYEKSKMNKNYEKSTTFNLDSPDDTESEEEKEDDTVPITFPKGKSKRSI